MTSAALSQKMRRLWADPEWARRQRERIADGSQRRKISRIPHGTPRSGAIQVTTRIDADDFAALQKLVAGQRISMAELIRTYIQWGLDEEGLSR